MSAIDVATRYRQQHPEHAGAGYVRVWNNQAYGWCVKRGSATTERPGALAVDAAGRVWEAIGGSDQDGAREWCSQFEARGIDWWNQLTPQQRERWLEAAVVNGTPRTPASAADAYRAYLAQDRPIGTNQACR